MVWVQYLKVASSLAFQRQMIEEHIDGDEIYAEDSFEDDEEDENGEISSSVVSFIRHASTQYEF
jgi:hypothetical protein